MPDADVRFTPLIIDGERRPASTGVTFPVRSPHTGALASTSAAASSEDCREAIDSAQRAFPAWEATSFAMRRDIMLRAAETIQSEAWQKKVEPVMLAEVAAPRAHVLFNCVASVSILKSVATLVNELKGETLPSITPGGHVFVQRRALGVVYVFFFASPSTPRVVSCGGAYLGYRYSVVPWNAPLVLMLANVTIPLICGNTVVVRPSEYCPYTSYLVVDALQHVSG